MNLNNSRIKGDLKFSHASVKDDYVSVGIDIGQDFRSDDSQFKNLDLTSAYKKGDVAISGRALRA
jgi:hypothetical protein